ncbi:MAG: thiamine pyrophosphate-binding protein [Streptomycetales bacterium]
MSASAQNGEPPRALPAWGSDVVADVLRATGVRYLALNPGASFRGLHDSLVNYLDGQPPEILLCLHEEHAVAVAHGYAKVTGRPLAVALHSNVGLMHASMAIYNAWCDRVPVFVIGATGPVDAAKRRPWIDWIHTAADQAALVRHYVKWDDQPASVAAAVESLARAWQVMRTPPYGPTYVCLDADLQESRVTQDVPIPALRGDDGAGTPVASPESVHRAAAALSSASRPVLLAGRVSRDPGDWQRRVQLAEALTARVVTDLKTGAAFPTEHPLHVPGPAIFLSDEAQRILSVADCVLSLDWIDLAGTLRQTPPAGGSRQVVEASLDHVLHNGWSKDHQGHTPVDVRLPTTPDLAVRQLLDCLPWTAPGPLRETRRRASTTRGQREPAGRRAASAGVTGVTRVTLSGLAGALRRALDGVPTCLVRLPLGWSGDDWTFSEPLDYLGYDGGGGIGSGPGMLVGAALGLRGSGRLPVAVLGDGDYLMGVQAFWTAARHRIPLLAVVANNRSYFNDELHQERVARLRQRDPANRWVGQRIDDPAPDLAALARAQGLAGIGPVSTGADLERGLSRALDALRTGRPTVLDVVVEAGYDTTMAAGVVGQPGPAPHPGAGRS